MKNIIFIIIAILALVSCQNPQIEYVYVYPEPEPPTEIDYDPELIYIWANPSIDRQWQFFEDLTIEFSEYPSEVLIDTWTYTADPDTGELVVIDGGVTNNFVYEILTDYPTSGDITFRYAPQSNPTSWIYYYRVDTL